MNRDPQVVDAGIEPYIFWACVGGWCWLGVARIFGWWPW
jgi:hypothetical protein